MKILLVGAGTVGQSYGHCLAQGGAEIAFLIKPKHREALADGLSLYPLNRPRRRRHQPVRLPTPTLLSAPVEAASHTWDAVWLCVSSTALRGPWFDELLPAIGDASVVMLQPGLEDRAWITTRMPERHLIQGMIALIAYLAPLPGETLPSPGVAYWFPPCSASPFYGPSERLDPLLALLQAGGCPVKRDPDVAIKAALGSAVLMPHVAELELADWRLAELRRSEHLARAHAASREAVAIASRYYERAAPWTLRLLRPHAMRLLTRLAPRATPFDLETYLRVHFTKVGDQTLHHLETLIGRGNALDLPTDALAELKARLEQARAR